MLRRRFLALSAGAAACLAGCGAERPLPGATGRPPYVILPGGARWRRISDTFARAARGAGFPVAERGPVTRVTVTGLPALAAAELNDGVSPMENATPLSRLAGEVKVVLVAGGSRFRTFEEFGARLLARPGETPLAGGPQGEPDHLLSGLIAKGLGADTRQLAYTGYPTSAEVGMALLSTRVEAAVGALADWRVPIERGRVRVLAVSCAERFPGLDAPSLLESGVRVDFVNWCAALGPARMAEQARASAIGMCEEVSGSPLWQQSCRSAGWKPIPLSGDEFEQWLAAEARRIKMVMRDLGLLETAGNTPCWGDCGSGH